MDYLNVFLKLCNIKLLFIIVIGIPNISILPLDPMRINTIEIG